MPATNAPNATKRFSSRCRRTTTTGSPTRPNGADASAQARKDAAILAVRKQCDEDSKEQLKLQLDGLEKYLAKDGAKGFTRDDIFEILIKAAAIYVGHRDVENRRAHLGELLGAAPPASFLELLKHERSFVICSLAEGPSSQEMQRAAERYRAIMGDLEKVAAVLPDPPPARSRGKPPNPKDLYALAAFLASQWERVTGEPFSQSWYTDDQGDRVPLAGGGAAFVHDIVKVIDPSTSAQ
jgi:hypothetical protein